MPTPADPSSWGLTRPEVEQMLQRVWNVYKDSYTDSDSPIRDWKAYAAQDLDTLALEVESESGAYARYLQRLPEEVTAYDLLAAYRAGRLPESHAPAARPEPIPLGDAPTVPTLEHAPWSSPAAPVTDATALRQAWITAQGRPTRATAAAIEAARTTLFYRANADPALDRELGVRWSEITAKLRSWAGWSAAARTAHARFNAGVPEAAQWHGLVNSSFFGRKRVPPESLAALVREIDAPAEGNWASPSGDELRNYILRTFPAIDTRTSYRDLAFKVDRSLKPLGNYVPWDRRITIRANSPHTVAHEIGHYLDHSWGGEIFGGRYNDYLSRGAFNFGLVSPLRARWSQAFRQFVHELGDRSDIRSEYTQDTVEVFARFVDRFVAWTTKTAGQPIWDDERYTGDRFHEGDFHRFVRLLQEKSVVDLKEPPVSRGTIVGRRSRVIALLRDGF